MSRRAADPTPEQRRRARACLERWLAGLQQAGHPPATPDDVRQVYAAALSRVGG